MNVLDIFFGPGNDLDLATMSPNARERLDPWVLRWQEGRGPAFLPRKRADRLYWYGLTEDETQRREVQRLLVHWVGPAVSDVAHRHGALDPGDPFDRDLEDQLAGRVVRLEVWPRASDGSTPSRDDVRRRIEGLVRMLDERPIRQHRTAASLPELLDELDLAATTGDAERADDLLVELEHRRLLDAPNTTFAAIRTKALLGQHREVVDEGLLQQLSGLRVPAGVVLQVARSVYEVHLRVPDVECDAVALLLHRGQSNGVLRHVLRQGSMTDERAVVVARAVVVGDEPGFAALLQGVMPDEPHLHALLDGLGVERHPPRTDDADPVAGQTGGAGLSAPEALLAEIVRLHRSQAHQAVLDLAHDAENLPPETHEYIILSADELDTEDAARAAVVVLEQWLGPLEEMEWPTRIIQRAVAGLWERAQHEDSTVASWEDWFVTVSEGADVIPGVEDGALDWPPLSADELLSRMQSITDPAPLARVVGRLRAAHDALFDVGQRGEFARTALAVLAFSDRADAAVQSASRELLVEVLDAGVPTSLVPDLMSMLEEILVSQLSVGTVGWALDLMSELTGELAVVSPAEVAALWRRLFDELRPLAGVIPVGRWLEVQVVVEQVELELPADIAARLSDRQEEDPLRCLDGKRIFLYSLRERAARQAATRLHSAGAQVELSAVHVGSPQLEGQVRGADVVVIVTAAAKHAATGFIEDAALVDPVHVNSAGMSGILTSMEELCAASAGQARRSKG